MNVICMSKGMIINKAMKKNKEKASRLSIDGIVQSSIFPVNVTRTMDQECTTMKWLHMFKVRGNVMKNKV